MDAVRTRPVESAVTRAASAVADDRPLVAPADLRRFVDGIAGRTILPGNGGYEAARLVHNATIDRRPRIVVRPADVPDVVRTVAFARDHGLELAVRSGGHSFAGHSTSEGGIVLDLSSMAAIDIDPGSRVAAAQAGITAGAFTAAAQAHGRIVPFGDTSSVGLGGLTLGGGIGWLVRKHGLTLDSLLAVELVTADGRLVTASADEEPELFWALRGGGGNFGVATRFHFLTHRLGPVYGGALFLPLTREVLRGTIELAEAAPEELTVIATAMRLPPMPGLPAELHGQPTLALLPVYAGDVARGEAVMAPFRALARPFVDAVGVMPYGGMYDLTAEAAKPAPAVTRSFFTDGLDDAAIDTIIGRTETASSPLAMTDIRVLGGAFAKVAPDATAFAHRERRLMVALITPFEDPAEADRHRAWVESYHADLGHLAAGAYANFLGDEGEGRIREAYPAGTYERLAAVKRAFDPDNLFRLNQNVRPVAGAERGR